MKIKFPRSYPAGSIVDARRSMTVSEDGVALKSIADPNFDEDGNCINETMCEFLKTRVRKN